MNADKDAVVNGRDIWKIFGRDPMAALHATRQNSLTKEEILTRFGAIIGVAGVSFDVYRGEILEQKLSVFLPHKSCQRK